MLSFVTRNADETVELGRIVGRHLRAGDFVALVGELGSGKTCFVRGVAEGLQVDPDEPVTSPTFALLHIHNGRVPLYHFDLYRLGGDEDVAQLGFTEYFYGDGVSVVEWADRLQEEMPAEYLTITFSHRGEDERSVDLAAKGGYYEHLIIKLNIL